MDAEGLLAQHGFRCERWSMTLLPQGCATIRANNPERCAGCEVASQASPIRKRNPRKPPMILEQEETVTEPSGRKKKVCSVPGCTEKHEAKGKCKKHYMREFNRRKANMQKAEQSPSLEGAKDEPVEASVTSATRKNPVRKPSVQKPEKTDNSIGKINLTFFEDDRSLFEEIVASAKRNRRALVAEVLFRLENGRASG